MAIVAGDIEEIAWNNANVSPGSGRWYPKSGETANFYTGGLRTDDSSDMVDGAGRGIYKKNRKRWEIETVISWDNNVSQELEQVTAIAEATTETVFTVSMVSGTVYKATGTVVGDVVGDGNNGTIDLKLSGGGKAEKIE